MIDIHSHLLPSLDDGASDWDEAIQMVQQAAADGIHTIIATPHHANGRYLNPASIVKDSVEEMNGRINRLGLDVTVLPGQEIRVYDRLLEDLNEGELVSLNHSQYLLLELPSSRVPKHMEELVHELSLLGITPIIAHPERNADIARDPGILGSWVELGALAQLTAQSVSGQNGKKLKGLSLELIKDGAAHLIASDAHDIVRRPFYLSNAYEVIKHELGSEVEMYLRDNATRVVSNLPILLPTFTSSKSRDNPISKLFSIFNR